MSAAATENATTVKLHHSLYAEEAIGAAAETFAEFAVFAVRSEGEHYVVELRDIDREVEGDVVAEFCNFALANSALRRRSDDV